MTTGFIHDNQFEGEQQKKQHGALHWLSDECNKLDGFFPELVLSIYQTNCVGS